MSGSQPGGRGHRRNLNRSLGILRRSDYLRRVVRDLRALRELRALEERRRRVVERFLDFLDPPLINLISSEDPLSNMRFLSGLVFSKTGCLSIFEKFIVIHTTNNIFLSLNIYTKIIPNAAYPLLQSNLTLKPKQVLRLRDDWSTTHRVVLGPWQVFHRKCAVVITSRHL